MACGERGTHSRKVLLFSGANTTLSSGTSNSSVGRKDTGELVGSSKISCSSEPGERLEVEVMSSTF